MSSSEKKKQKAIERLQEIDGRTPIRLVFRDGRAEDYCLIYNIDIDVAKPRLFYTHDSPYNAEHGSMIDPRDFMPSVELRDLGYVRTPEGRKVSLVPFHY